MDLIVDRAYQLMIGGRLRRQLSPFIDVFDWSNMSEGSMYPIWSDCDIEYMGSNNFTYVIVSNTLPTYVI